MENQKTTAVEWLEQEMLKPKISMKEIIEQAKEMENQQIIDAYDNGKHLFYDANEYFKQTFNKNKNE